MLCVLLPPVFAERIGFSDVGVQVSFFEEIYSLMMCTALNFKYFLFIYLLVYVNNSGSVVLLHCASPGSSSFAENWP